MMVMNTVPLCCISFPFLNEILVAQVFRCARKQVDLFGSEFRDAGWRVSMPTYAQVIIGANEEFKIRLHLFKSEMLQLGIVSQLPEVRGTHCFEGHDGIKARLAARHAHDFEDGSFVKLIVQLVFVNEQQIRNEGQIELSVAKRKLRKPSRDVTKAAACAVVREKCLIRAFAKTAEVFRRTIKIPAIGFQAGDGVCHLRSE